MNLKFVLTIKKMAKIGRKVSNIRIRIRVRQMVRLDLYPNYILKIRIHNTVNILSFIKKNTEIKKIRLWFNPESEHIFPSESWIRI